MAKRYQNRSYNRMLQAAIRDKAALYIAHNPGALAVAAEAARRTGARFAFDAEDFHRGETPLESKESRRIALLEDTYLPQAAYISAASPLIARAYQELFPDKKVVTINNVFSLRQQPPFQPLPDGPLRLFWFSQTLGLDRGLDDLMKALEWVADIPITITLLGQGAEEIKKILQAYLQSPHHSLTFCGLMDEDQLILLSAGFHIGMALERKTPLNRNLCLTNKIFTYLLAGNAIIASETDAQLDFMHRYPQVGKSYPIGDVRALADILRYYHTHRDELEQTRRNAWNLAHTELNWEKEQEKFLELVENALKQA